MLQNHPRLEIKSYYFLRKFLRDNKFSQKSGFREATETDYEEFLIPEHEFFAAV